MNRPDKSLASMFVSHEIDAASGAEAATREANFIDCSTGIHAAAGDCFSFFAPCEKIYLHRTLPLRRHAQIPPLIFQSVLSSANRIPRFATSGLYIPRPMTLFFANSNNTLYRLCA